MQKRSSKSESTRKIEQNRSGWKFLTTVKVNGQSQRSKSTVNADVCWRGNMTSPRADVAEEKQQQARVARGLARVGRMRRVEDTSGAWWHVLEAETSAGAWGGVWCSFWPFLVGFCSGLDVLSFYACCLAVERTEHWYPSVAGTVGVTVVARFWQWRLDEGEGSGRTPEMSTGTRKSEE